MAATMSRLMSPFAASLARIAHEAGRLILNHYAQGPVARVKADFSPVTAADEEAEKLILARLAELAPGVPTIAEEEVAAGRLPEVGSRFFVVDPLDGTKEFIKRNGEFTVNIALIENGVPVFGIIYVPVKEQLYYAVKDKWAFLIENEKVIKLPNAIRKEGEFIIVASRSHLSPETEEFINQSTIHHPLSTISLISSGSSIKFCLVAQGKADVYPRFAPTMEWDTAAGHIIATETGK